MHARIPSLNLGFRREVLWTRLALRNPGADDLERWLHLEPPHLEQVSLFLQGADGAWQRQDGGVRNPGPARAISGRIIAFPLHLPAGTTRPLLLRVQSRLPLTVRPMLWTPAALRTAVRWEDQLSLLGIGTLLGLALYALLLYPLQRDRSSLFLGVTVLMASMIHLISLGFGQGLLWPDAPEWATRARQFFVAAAVCGLLLFLRELLARPAAVGLGGMAGLGAGAPGAARPGGGACQRLCPAGGGLRPGAAGGDGGQLLGVVATALMALLFFAAISRRLDLLRRETDAARAEALAVQTRAAERLQAEAAVRIRDLRAAKEHAEGADRATRGRGRDRGRRCSAWTGARPAHRAPDRARDGGKVTVRSRPGRGSRFRLRVTLAVADEAEVPALLPDLRVQGCTGPRRRLLVVEDHPANRCWLEQLFAELGFTVHAVSSVAEAHQVLAQQAVDLALPDQRLPDGSAWDRPAPPPRRRARADHPRGARRRGARCHRRPRPRRRGL